jgi:hypothetical protein
MGKNICFPILKHGSQFHSSYLEKEHLPFSNGATSCDVIDVKLMTDTNSSFEPRDGSGLTDVELLHFPLDAWEQGWTVSRHICLSPLVVLSLDTAM